MKKIIALLLALIMVLGLVACGQPSGPSGENTEPGNSDPVAPSGTVQGVTDTTIYIGNTAATTGAFAAVGVPSSAR